MHLDPHYFETDSGMVTGVQMIWYKRVRGKITNSKWCGSIDGSASEQQYIEIKVSSEGKTENGKRTGKWKVYFDDNWEEATVASKIQYYRIIDYDSGPPWRVNDYYLSGQKQFEGKIIKDAPDTPVGPSRFYFADGKLEQEGDYDLSGGRTGEWKFYHWNGNIKEKGRFDRDKKIGVWKSFDENGKLTSSERQ
jgi:antitoxin component YwqK of YwqJK toxin-antitoxin module